MAAIALLQQPTFDPEQWVFDRELNAYHNTLWRRVVVWIVSWVSSTYDPVQVAEKVAAVFQRQETPPSPHVKFNLDALKRKYIAQSSIPEEKIVEILERIPFPRVVIVQPPLLWENYHAEQRKRALEEAEQKKWTAMKHAAFGAAAVTIAGVKVYVQKALAMYGLPMLLNQDYPYWQRPLYMVGVGAVGMIAQAVFTKVNQVPMQVVTADRLFSPVIQFSPQIQPLILASLMSGLPYFVPLYASVIARAMLAGGQLPPSITSERLLAGEGGYLGYLVLNKLCGEGSYFPAMAGLAAIGAYFFWERSRAPVAPQDAAVSAAT